MTHRFQIDELVVQDAFGVVFRALDTQTGQYVALRRFFPYGANGGGLNPEEQEDYMGAVTRLSAVEHPSLRSVISGGCDPIDGMPFIATEWIEGTRLRVFLDQGPLDTQNATRLLVQALDVCQILSKILAEEAIWIETGLQAIVVAAPDSGRGVTFWISPLKCLGKHDGQTGLESLVTLTENIMGWSGEPSDDPAGNSLAEWLNWLKAAPTSISLHEVRERLVRTIEAKPPTPTRKVVSRAQRTGRIAEKKSSSKIPIIVISCLLLCATALGSWALIRRNNASLTKPLRSASPALEISLGNNLEKPRAASEPIISPKASEEVTAAAGKTTEEKEVEASRLQEEIAKRGGIYTIADHDLLIAQRGKVVTLEGILLGFGHSGKKKTMYLQFSTNPEATEACGSVRLKSAAADLQQESLALLVGKKIRVSGKVAVHPFSKRPVIPIKSRTAIQEVE